MGLLKSWLLLVVVCIQTTFTTVSGAILTTIGGCSCLDSWELNNNTYIYPNNCVDPLNKGFTWCITSKSPPCFGVSGSISWDRCEPPQQIQVNRLQETFSERQAHDGIYDAIVDLFELGEHNIRHISTEPNINSNNVEAELVLTGKGLSNISDSERLMIMFAGNCECYPGRGSCNEHGDCICTNRRRFVGSNCGECGDGFHGPECTPTHVSSPFSVFYFFLLFLGVSFCCLLSCVVLTPTRTRGSKWLRAASSFINGSTNRAIRTDHEMKEFSISADLLISDEENGKCWKRKTKEKTSNKSDSTTKNKNEESLNDVNPASANETLLDFSADTVYEFDSYTQSYYMLHAEACDSDNELMDSLNENGDFELEF